MGVTTSVTIGRLDGDDDEGRVLVEAMARLGWTPIEKDSHDSRSGGLTTRTIHVSRRGAWMVAEEMVGFEPGQLAQAIESALRYSVDIFDSDNAVVGRHTDGEPVWLFIGDAAPPGVGRLHAASLPVFATDSEGVSPADLRRVVTREAVLAEDACASFFEALGVPFEFDASDTIALVFTDGTDRTDADVGSGFSIRSVSWSGPLAGVVGDAFSTRLTLLNWRLTGRIPDVLTISVSGTALEQELVELTSFRYSIPVDDRRWRTAPEHRATLVGGELRVMVAGAVNVEGSETPAGSDDRRLQDLWIGIDGQFLRPGSGTLALAMHHDSVEVNWRCAQLDVGVLPVDRAPARRPSSPTNGESRYLLPFADDDWLVVHVALESDHDDIASAVDLFHLWVSLLDLDDSDALMVGGVSGVRSLTKRVLGGSSRRWARAEQGLRSESFVLAQTGDWNDERVPRFQKSELDAQRQGAVTFMLPNDAGSLDELQRRLDLITTAPEIRQISVLACGHPTHQPIERLYEIAIGLLSPGSVSDYIIDPGDLIYIEGSLANKLAESALSGVYERTDLDHCVRLRSVGALLPTREAALEKALRPQPEPGDDRD